MAKQFMPSMLYHGTTLERALDILNKSRFKVGEGNKFWLTVNQDYARRVAETRAGELIGEPAVVQFSCDTSIPVNVQGHPVQCNGQTYTIHLPNASQEQYFSFGGLTPMKVYTADGREFV
jgi:hypothetical protein